MARTAFLGTLPVFSILSELADALDDPEVTARGAVVSTDGDKYRIHRLDELSAAVAEVGRSGTFASLMTKGRALEPSTHSARRKAGLVLNMPSGKTASKANRAFTTSLGVAPRFDDAAKVAMAWIFTYSGRNFVLVGNSYVCSKYGENGYNDDDYRSNNGQCPNHKDSRLIRQP